MLAGRLANVAAAAGLVWCTAALARRIAFVFHLAALEEKAGLIEGAGDGGA